MKWKLGLIAASAFALGTSAAHAADGSAAALAEAALKSKSIGFLITDEVWGVYQTPEGKVECPTGLNQWGPREQFKALFPEDGTKRTLVEGQLSREAASWFPTLEPDRFPFREAQGKIAYGLNLDGKVKDTDFTSPDGDKGIDNQLYRAIGCIEEYRGPTGILHFLVNRYLRDFDYNRVMFEITKLDDLTNDPDVDVTILRGRDRPLADATGNDIIPGGSQRVDARWGKRYVQKLHGKIVDGVLMTDPADISLPHAIFNSIPGEDSILGARFQLKMTSERAEGVLAGYSDIDKWYWQLMHSWSTHHQSYGQLSSPSLYKKLHELADGYPDPKTGKNTAISSALQVKFTQVFIQHPPQEVAAKDSDQRATDTRPARH